MESLTINSLSYQSLTLSQPAPTLDAAGTHKRRHRRGAASPPAELVQTCGRVVDTKRSKSAPVLAIVWDIQSCCGPGARIGKDHAGLIENAD